MEVSKVKYGKEIGRNLRKIGQKLAKNQKLLKLLVNTGKDPLNEKVYPEEIDGLSLLNKNIKFIPLLTADEQKETSKIVLFFEDGEINESNSDNENLSLLINVYCPFNEWLITGEDLRPFAIMSEIRETIQDRRINGLGEIRYLNFSINSLTEEMGCYSMRFSINVFS